MNLAKWEIKLLLRFILEQCEIEMMPTISIVHLILNAEILVAARDIVKTYLCALNKTWYVFNQTKVFSRMKFTKQKIETISD
jgi:hypothetical protein